MLIRNGLKLVCWRGSAQGQVRLGIARVFAEMIIRLRSFIVGVTLFATCACLGTNAVAAKYAAIVVEVKAGRFYSQEKRIHLGTQHLWQR